MVDCIEYYKLVNTWNDLIQTNILFMNDDMIDTFYHCAPLDDETLEQDFFKACLAVNKKGILTINSQPYEDTHKCHKNSYIEFYTELDIGYKLYNYLSNDPRIFISYINYANNISQDNFEEDKFNLTHYIDRENNRYINYSNWNRNNQTSTIINNIIIKSFPIIYNILSNSCKFFVVCKNAECAPQIILESIEMLY